MTRLQSRIQNSNDEATAFGVQTLISTRVSPPASAVAASLGAPFASLANITSALLPKLPPALQTYLDTSIDSVSSTLSSSTAFLQSTTGLSPTIFYSTIAGALVLGAARTLTAKKSVPPPKPAKKKKASKSKASKSKAKNMRRYGGWSSGNVPHQLSPFPSSLSQDGIPNVTDEDYEYIMSDDLQDQDGSYFRPPDDDDLNDIPQDDVLLFRHDNRIDKEYFPAYSIGDGKLYTSDIRDRVQLLYKLTDSQADRVKLYYKGKALKVDDQAVCLGGVKNNSEILVVFPEDPGSPDSEVGGSTASGRSKHSKSKLKKNRKVNTSPPQPGPSSSGGLEVPRGRDNARGGSSSRAPSATSGASGATGISRISSISMPPAATGSAMEKLNNIALHFDTKLLPLCEKFLSQTPSDLKKRGDEHRKISETIMQQVILKLDEVDTGGDDATRARRKALVNHVQDILKEMDRKVDKKSGL